MFGAFSAYWTVITFELIDQHHLSQVQVGLFGLVGAAGAAAAPLGGWLADHGYGRPGSGAALLLGSMALVIASLGHGSLILLGAGAVLLDLAVQCHGVMSQQEIYGLHSGTRARINTVFMGSTFVGGAIGSACAGALHAAYGWTASSLFAAALPLIGFAVWLTGIRKTAGQPG
jgi:predicted MFS family arabinose efflux permease